MPPPVRPIRPAAVHQPAGSNSKNYLIVALLLTTVTSSTIAWNNYQTVQTLKDLVPKPGVQRTVAANRGGPAVAVDPNAQPQNNFGGRGGRGGGGINAIIQNLNLTPDQVTEVTQLDNNRRQAGQDAANAAGINRRDPAYQQVAAQAQAPFDDKIRAIIGDAAFQQYQSMPQGGRGGRGGGGGGGG